MTRRLATSSLALMAMAAPALADITPAEVWEQLIKENVAVGATVTEGSREEAGATLTITDVVFTTTSQGGGSKMTLPKLVFNETGDGGVRWMLEGDVTGEITQTGVVDDKPITIPFTVSMPGNETVTTGTVDDMTHEYKADGATVTVDLPGAAEGAAPNSLTVTAEAITGTQRSISGEDGKRDLTYASKIEKANVTVAVDTPKTDDSSAAKFTGQGEINGLEISGEMALAEGQFNLETQMDEALKAGTEFAFDMTYTDSAGSFEFSGTDVDGTENQGNGSTKSGPGNLVFSLSDDGISYAGGIEASENQMTISSLPFPITYNLAAAKFDMAMPVMQSETAAPFKMVTAITGLTLNDEIWAMFDPQAKLSRDPADLNIDVTGDLLMPEALFTVPAPAEAAPAEGAAEPPVMPKLPQPPMPTKVTINDVTIKAVGAEAHLKGELVAAEGGDMTTGPIGQIDGEFSGVNALLDALGSIGLISEEQLAGPRMMLAMFAKPVEGETDKLETKLEFREGGSVFANGQQVK